MRHKYSVFSAVFSPDGATIVTLSEDSTARIWVLAPPSTVPPPDWVPDLAEAVGGYRINDQGILETVAPETILPFRVRFRKAQGKDPYSQIARWFFADKDTRPASPYDMDMQNEGGD